MANFGFLLRCSSPSAEVDKNVSYVCKLTPESVAGRSQNSALCLPDLSISRTHCLFSFDPEHQYWTVQDKSRSGTWINSRRIPPDTIVPLQYSDLICFGPTKKFVYTFRTYQTDGSSSSSGAGSSGIAVDNSGVAGTSGTSGSNQGSSSNRAGAVLKAVVDPMAESETPRVAWSDGGPSSSLGSTLGSSQSSRVGGPLCHPGNDMSAAGPSSGVKRAACPSEEVLAVKRTRSSDVRELSCQLEHLHVKECRLLKDMEEMLMSVQLKFHKNMALLREEQLKLAEQAQVQQRSRLITELNIRENCNRALSGVRHRINEIHVQMRQTTSQTSDEDEIAAGSTRSHMGGFLDKEELERLVESLRDSEQELQRRLEVVEQERDGLRACCEGISVDLVRPQRSSNAQPCSSEGAEEGAVESESASTPDEMNEVDEQANDADSDPKAKSRPKLKPNRKLKPKTEDTEQVKKNVLQSIGNLMEEELQCSICNEMFIGAVTINCSHTFCRFCLNQWKQHRLECPMCRMPITGEHRSIAIDSFISSMMQQMSDEAQERHKEVVAERAAREAARASTSGTSQSGPSTSSGNPGQAGQQSGHPQGPHPNQVPVHPGRPWNGVYLLRRLGGNGNHNGNNNGNGGNVPAPPANIAAPPPGSPEHRNARSRRRNGRLPAAISPSSSSASSSEDQSETSAYSGFSTPSWTEQEYSNRDYDDEDDSEYEPAAIVPGIPGRYYGGYGVCFYCRQRGHWSNGCPVRFRY